MTRAIVLPVMLMLLVGGTVLSQEARQPRPPQQAAYQQMFVLRGIEFSADQQTKVDEIHNKYEPKLAEIQKKQMGVFTDEQMQARRKAFRVAREAGKEGPEAREAAEAALKLTEEQKDKLATIQKERAELTAQIQNELRALLTGEQRSQLRGQGRPGPRRPGLPPTHRDVKYGPYDRNVMDVWLAESDKPTPVLVSIHGGGFRGGNKSVSGDLLKQCLEYGISVVAITYRLSDEAIAPAQFLDSARAIQFIRHNAKQWNLDPTRIAATGGSAGAGISLWLGFHDDLADPDSQDPVFRQSTRLKCMAVYNGQTSYDPRFIRDLFPDTDTYKESALAQLFGVDLSKLDDLPQDKYRLFEEVSALPHLRVQTRFYVLENKGFFDAHRPRGCKTRVVSGVFQSDCRPNLPKTGSVGALRWLANVETSPHPHLTKDDAPAALFYASEMDTPITSQGIGIHHPRFGKALKDKMDELGIECEVHTGIPRGDEWTKLTMDFVKKHLTAQ